MYFRQHIEAYVPTMKKYKRNILEIYNFYRNLLAGGGASSAADKNCFPIDRRMREFIGDDELQCNSKLHLKAGKGWKYRNMVHCLLGGQNLVSGT